MIRLIFIRHGATAGNLEKRYIGCTDEPLCAVGVAQIQELKQQNFQADKIFVSPMRRARQTAEILFPNRACTVVHDFRETDFGIFEGKTANELSDDPKYQSWVNSWCKDAIPEGESVDSFKMRCCRAFDKAMTSVEHDETAAFVVHGGTIMAIMEAYVRPHRNYYDYYIENGKQLVCVYDNGVIKNSCSMEVQI